MPKFLHLADIHLGFDRYDNRDRTQDFFRALYDALERYAVAEAVDFVLIAGDLFEHRNIQPSTLNQAQICLQLLQDAHIPVLAIEGNHDNRPFGTKTSWLRYLADWGLLILLEPGNVTLGEPLYSHWNGNTGGYIDLECGVRVMGSSWYGSAAPKAIEQIVAALPTLPPSPGATILLFHHGLEGQIARYAGALRYAEVEPLRHAGVNYLALGHIHKQYAVEGWIFNPGSIEANSVEESQMKRGVYLVELTETEIRAELKRDYYQRPIVRLRLALRGTETVEDVEAEAIAHIQQAIQSGQIEPAIAPIVEFRIDGKIGFDRLDLNVRELQAQLQLLSGALIFLLKYDPEPVAYTTHLPEEANRLQIEQEIFIDCLSANSTYRRLAESLAPGLIDLKDRQLQGQPESELYTFAQNLLEQAHASPTELVITEIEGSD
jgi:DNA repair exonuclease SbcCD nuclease subunit